jgi:hypothetical protein
MRGRVFDSVELRDFMRFITIRKITFLILLGFVLQGCSSMSRKECETANWSQLGFKSGASGETFNDSVDAYDKKCTVKHNVTMTMTDFKKGYNLGLQKYCTNENGYIEGQNLSQYLGVCPKELEENFLKGHSAGQIIGLKQTVDLLRSKVSALESEVSSKDSEISALRARNCSL